MMRGAENRSAAHSPPPDDIGAVPEIPALTDTTVVFEITPRTLKKVPLNHEYLYVLWYDLVHLNETAEITPVALLKELLTVGIIVDGALVVGHGADDAPPAHDPLWYVALYSTILGPEIIGDAVNAGEDSFYAIDREHLPDVDVVRFDVDTRQVSLNAGELHADPGATEAPPESPDLPAYAPKIETPAAPAMNWVTESREIAVDLTKLDRLINLVGELVIAESMVTKNPEVRELSLESFDRASHSLRRIISELQDVVMSFRTVPLSATFRQVTRMIREMTARSTTPIQLKLIGEETEVDKTVIEQITGPLIRLIRFCIQYGIEPRDQRRAAGKPDTGTITLSGQHEGTEVLIRVADDGAGLDREALMHQAARKGWTREREGFSPSDREVFRWIFDPEFSPEDTNGPARTTGPGLDLVLKNIEDVNGRIDVDSTRGRGTIFSLRIPMTVVIMDGMLIRVGRSSFTIPLLSIHESFRPAPDQITKTAGGQELVMIRGHLVPVIRLHRCYRLAADHERLDEGILINVSAGGRKACLFIDEIVGHHQSVIKEMPDYVGTTSGISGCSILEDGSVSLVLDIGGVLDMAETIEPDDYL